MHRDAKDEKRPMKYHILNRYMLKNPGVSLEENPNFLQTRQGIFSFTMSCTIPVPVLQKCRNGTGHCTRKYALLGLQDT